METGARRRKAGADAAVGHRRTTPRASKEEGVMTGEVVTQLGAGMGLLLATLKVTAWGRRGLMFVARECSRRWTKRKESDFKTVSSLTVMFLPLGVLFMLAGENAMAAVLLLDLMVMSALFVFTATMWPAMTGEIDGRRGASFRRMDRKRRRV